MYVLLTATITTVGTMLTPVDGTLSAIRRLDRNLVGWVTSHRTGTLDDAASISSSLADTWTVLALAGGASAVLIACGLRRRVAVLLVGLPLEFATFLVVSSIVDSGRPGLATGPVPSTGSFPSGHAAVAVVLYGGLAVVLRSLTTSTSVRRVSMLVGVAVPPVVAVSRVYEGLHHPIDVVAGALLGAASLAVAVAITRSVPSPRPVDEVATAPGDTLREAHLSDGRNGRGGRLRRGESLGLR